MENDAVVFGFVPWSVVDGLRTYGNWKVRQGALDALGSLVHGRDHRHESKAEIPQFFGFLLELMDDPNFKIKQGSIRLLRQFIESIDSDAEIYLRSVVPKMVEKLTDPKDYVHDGCIDVFRAVLKSIGICAYFDRLRKCFRPSNNRIKEEIVQLYNMGLQLAGEDTKTKPIGGQYGLSTVGEALIEAVLDSSSAVAEHAMEGWRLLHDVIPSGEFFAFLNSRAQLPEDLLLRIREHCQAPHVPLPQLNSKGGHVVVQEADSYKNTRQLSSMGYVPRRSTADNSQETQKSAKLYEAHSGQSCNMDCQKQPIPTQDLPSTNTRAVSGSLPTSNGEDVLKRTGGDHRCRSLDKTTSTSVPDRMFFRRLLRATAQSNDPSTIYQPKTRNQQETSTSTCTAEEQTKSTGPSSEDHTTTRATESRYQVTARIDQISRLIKKRDDVQNQTEQCSTSVKQSPIFSRKKQNLERLKMKQKDRRTHSANAILQRKSEEESKAQGGDAFNCQTDASSWNTGIQPFPKGSVPSEASGFELNEDVPDFLSSPGSITRTAPGTYSSNFPKCLAMNDISGTEPFIDPEAVMQSVINRLTVANNARKKEMDWISQAEALNDARRLVQHHVLLVKRQKRDFIAAFLPAIQQLRSTTARTAILLCQEFLERLGETIEHEVDDIAPILLKKAGETSNAGASVCYYVIQGARLSAGRDTFLASEADKALAMMIRRVSCVRSLNVLLQNANNSSKYVRAKVAAHLDDCLHLASTKLKSAVHLPLVDRIFVAAAVTFLEEGALDTRTHGKRILWELKLWINNKGAFERLMGQLETESKQRRVRDVIEHPDGPPPLPSRTTLSQKTGSSLTPLTPTRTPPSRIDRLEYGAARARSKDPAGSTSPRERSPELRLEKSSSQERFSKKPPRPRDSHSTEPHVQMHKSLSTALSHLCSKDWRQRIDALQQIESMAGQLCYMNDREMMMTMDQLTYRLNDGNSKVILTALETLHAVFGSVGKRILPSLNTVLPATVSNLASSSDKIRASAESVIDQLIDSVDGVYLVQNLSHCCTHGNHKTKAILLHKLEAIVALGDIWLDVREANACLLRSLEQSLGDLLLERADEALTAANRQRLFDILHGNY